MAAPVVTLVANGDLRESANQVCWPAQEAMEARITAALCAEGVTVERAHAYDAKRGHGFIGSQREGMDIFAGIDRSRPLIVAESVWQYSHHLLHGLIDHRAPILTVANWSGQWPGLVGMLNLNGCLTKAGVPYSTLWSENFDDASFLQGLRAWLREGKVTHPHDHVTPLAKVSLPDEARRTAEELAATLRRDKAILGIFDEGCMGMYNAIIPDELLFSTGVYKERLSQSALYAAMREVSGADARGVYQWLLDAGMTFHYGPDDATDLTEAQVLEQCRMYLAACRLGHSFGCDALGIQYQQGLKDLTPASDLVEGVLNNAERPPAFSATGEPIRLGLPYTHFNEVDECAGLDGLLTERVHRRLGQPSENTLHDIRWGDADASATVPEYVWVFLISGGAPPAHHLGGYRGTHGYRQPPMYFRLGGATCSGVAKPGEIVWSRIFVDHGKLCMDLGRARVVELPEAETQRRLDATTPVWPIMHAVTYGVSRDQMMGRHKANHLQVAYANDTASADACLLAKAALALELGLEVALCGTRADGSPWS